MRDAYSFIQVLQISWELLLDKFHVIDAILLHFFYCGIRVTEISTAFIVLSHSVQLFMQLSSGNNIFLSQKCLTLQYSYSLIPDPVSIRKMIDWILGFSLVNYLWQYTRLILKISYSIHESIQAATDALSESPQRSPKKWISLLASQVRRTLSQVEGSQFRDKTEKVAFRRTHH